MFEAGVGRFVFSSSAAVYGTPRVQPIPEEHPLEPSNPYGATKAMVERILADLDRAHGLRFVTLRYFNAAGADPDGAPGRDARPRDPSHPQYPALRPWGRGPPSASSGPISRRPTGRPSAITSTSRTWPPPMSSPCATSSRAGPARPSTSERAEGTPSSRSSGRPRRSPGARSPSRSCPGGRGMSPSSWRPGKRPGASSAGSPGSPISGRSSGRPGTGTGKAFDGPPPGWYN